MPDWPERRERMRTLTITLALLGLLTIAWTVDPCYPKCVGPECPVALEQTEDEVAEKHR